MLSTVNDYQRPYANQRAPTNTKSYSCVIYIDQPSRYSIVDSKRLTNVDENGRGFIKELHKSYKIRVEQTGNHHLSSMFYSISIFLSRQPAKHGEIWFVIGKSYAISDARRSAIGLRRLAENTVETEKQLFIGHFVIRESIAHHC